MSGWFFENDRVIEKEVVNCRIRIYYVFWYGCRLLEVVEVSCFL